MARHGTAAAFVPTTREIAPILAHKASMRLDRAHYYTGNDCTAALVRSAPLLE